MYGTLVNRIFELHLQIDVDRYTFGRDVRTKGIIIFLAVKICRTSSYHIILYHVISSPSQYLIMSIIAQSIQWVD